MPRVENKKPVKKANQSKKQTKKDQTDYKIIKISSFVLLAIVILFSGYLLVDRYILNNGDDEVVERFEDIEHLTLNEFKYLLNDDETNVVENLNYDIYVFIYNSDYETCTLCEDLESNIKQAASQAEANGYSFFVLDYQDYQDISSYVSNTYLPDLPALIHIEGEAYADENAVSTSRTAILSILSQIA